MPALNVTGFEGPQFEETRLTAFPTGAKRTLATFSRRVSTCWERGGK